VGLLGLTGGGGGGGGVACQEGWREQKA
jgi:hypothetical protein